MLLGFECLCLGTAAFEQARQPNTRSPVGIRGHGPDRKCPGIDAALKKEHDRPGSVRLLSYSTILNLSLIAPQIGHLSGGSPAAVWPQAEQTT